MTCGCVAATYAMVTGWYDTARVDSLALALVLLAAAPLARRDPGWARVLLSAALACAAIYTKQTTVFFAAALCVVVFLQHRRKGLAMAAAMGLICLAALLTLQQVTGGGFLVWLMNMRHHVFHPLGLLEGLWVLLSRAPFLLLLPWLVRRGLSAPAVLMLALLAAALPAGLIPYAKQGGSTNSLIPVWFLAGPTVLLLLGERLRGRAAGVRRGALVMVLAFQVVYLPFFFFSPARAWQDAAGLARARALNRVVAGLEGGVVCPVNPFLPVRNGHRTPQAGWISHTDAMWAGMPGVTPESYARWLRGTGARWLLLTGEPVNKQEARLRRLIEETYVLERTIGAPSWDGMWQTNPLPGVLLRRKVRPAAGRAAPP